MYTLSFEGYAVDYIARYIHTNNHDAFDNAFFLNQLTLDENNLSIASMTDDDTYQPFYDFMKGEFKNDSIILLGRSAKGETASKIGHTRKRR